jgi:hypothetical protein
MSTVYRVRGTLTDETGNERTDFEAFGTSHL